MKQEPQYRSWTHKVPVRRKAGLALALGGLSGLVLAAGTADAAAGVVVSTTKNPSQGTILVSGKTLYTLKASKTPCTAQCLKIWPALMLPKGVTKATAGTGVRASKLGTVKRSGGSLQVTYSGKPLYFFVGDAAAGKVNGNITDTWGKWSDVVTVKCRKQALALAQVPAQALEDRLPVRVACRSRPELRHRERSCPLSSSHQTVLLPLCQPGEGAGRRVGREWRCRSVSTSPRPGWWLWPRARRALF